MEYKDYYQTLGVPKDASADDIKKAYRKLIRKYHPDVSKAKDADRKTKEINEAYGVLGDAEKRAAYDALGSGMRAGQPFEPPPDWARGFDMGGGHDDFFADLFAHVGRRGHAGRAGFAMRGEDIHASMAIDLRDSYTGASRVATLRVAEPDAQGRLVQRDLAVTVKIPKGILPGQHIRLAGHGQPGSGGAPGDLVLEISFHPDPHYRIEGRDVYRDLAVAPWEAALGADIDAPTPAGTVRVSVPPGSQNGRKLRLKGRGIPGHPAGDLYLVLDVILPPASSARARALYEAMARDMAFNPRAAPGG